MALTRGRRGMEEMREKLRKQFEKVREKKGVEETIRLAREEAKELRKRAKDEQEKAKRITEEFYELHSEAKKLINYAPSKEFRNKLLKTRDLEKLRKEVERLRRRKKEQEERVIRKEKIDTKLKEAEKETELAFKKETELAFKKEKINKLRSRAKKLVKYVPSKKGRRILLRTKDIEKLKKAVERLETIEKKEMEKREIEQWKLWKGWEKEMKRPEKEVTKGLIPEEPELLGIVRKEKPLKKPRVPKKIRKVSKKIPTERVIKREMKEVLEVKTLSFEELKKDWRRWISDESTELMKREDISSKNIQLIKRYLADVEQLTGAAKSSEALYACEDIKREVEKLLERKK